MKPISYPSSKTALEVRLVIDKERARFDHLLATHHDLGACPPVGDFLGQVLIRQGQWVALLVWGPAALKLRDREEGIGWTPAMALERLKLVVCEPALSAAP